MTDLVVHPPSDPLRGRLRGSPDAAATQIALLLSAFSARGSGNRVLARGAPSLEVPELLAALGVSIEAVADGWWVEGGGLSPFFAPSGPVPCPDHPEPMGLVAGLLCAQPFPVTLRGSERTVRQQLAPAAALLRARGARIEGVLDPERPGELGPPVQVAPVAGLSEVSWEASFEATAVKPAALGSGMLARGPTLFHEPVVRSDRCERQLMGRGAALTTMGPTWQLAPLEEALAPIEEQIVAGDGGLAAVLLAAGLAMPGSLIEVSHVAVSPSRSGWLEVLRDAGAEIWVEAGQDAFGEATADLRLLGGPLGGLKLAGERAARVGAALPLLAAAAVFAKRESTLAEIPVSHPGQPRATLEMLRAFGVDAAWRDGGIEVAGGSEPRACELSAEDPEVAMAATVVALGARGTSRIRNAEAIVAVFPRFVGCLRALGAKIDVE